MESVISPDIAIDRSREPADRGFSGLWALLKTTSILAMMGLFILHSLSYELREPRRWRQRRLRAGLAQKYARIALKVLRVKVNLRTDAQWNPDRPRLLVGNHLSYLDALVLAAQKPVNFVTSMEVREAPGLGALTVLAGCLYVERRSRANLSAEIQEVRDALVRGFNFVIFPEATSTNGDDVLRFRQPLFRSSVESERPVGPFCLNYRDIDGDPVRRHNRDTVCWYGAMAFLPHLWNLTKRSRIGVDLHWLRDIEINDDSTPAHLSQASHAAVKSVFISLG